MNYCRYCKRKIPPAWKFCNHCNHLTGKYDKDFDNPTKTVVMRGSHEKEYKELKEKYTELEKQYNELLEDNRRWQRLYGQLEDNFYKQQEIIKSLQ